MLSAMTPSQHPAATVRLFLVGAVLAALGGCAWPIPARPGDPVDDVEPGRITIPQNREYSTSERRYVISAHRPSYLAVVSYNSRFDPGIYPSSVGLSDTDTEDFETKFQLSGKFSVAQNVLSNHTDLYFGYTQQSYWQVYADGGALSRPFRETNYEPELFLRHYSSRPLPFGGRLAGVDLGLNHQSNGQSEPISRSWNRVMMRAAATWDDFALLTRAWIRFPESDEEDENPNEYRYLGYGDVRGVYSHGDQTFSAMVRPGTEGAAVELTYSVPIGDGPLRFYLQYFSGRGENLYEFEDRSNRISIGVAVTDWLIGDQ